MTEPKSLDRFRGRELFDNPRPSHRRAMAFGLGASAALHLLVIIVYSLGLDDWGPTENTLGVESASRPFSGMRVVQVVEISQAETPPDVVREELPVPEPVVDVRSLGAVADPTEGRGVSDEDEVGRAVRAAEVLRVRSADHRLWRPALPEIFELTEAERLQLELAGLLEAWHDSVAIALAAESALTDWTMTDGDGNRWGVSKGQLHLGSLTLPLPVYFGGTTWQRERAERRAWEDADILNNLSSQAARASWEERAKAIRERKDRQRDEGEAQPDTSRSSGARPPPSP